MEDRSRKSLVSFVHAKLLQSCPNLCDPMDCSPQGSSVHGILQARTRSKSPCPPPGDLLNTGIKPKSSVSPALAGGFFTTSTTWEAPFIAAVFAITRTWKQPRSRCLLTGEWIKKMWCIYIHTCVHTLEYYSAIKRTNLSQI